MIVQCLTFGSLWWLRPGRDKEHPERFTSQAAVFNTTGFCHGARDRRNWIIAGVIRFNAGTILEQRLNAASLDGGCFETCGLERSGSWNRLLLLRRIRAVSVPDAVLVTVQKKEFGKLRFSSEWRTPEVRIVAASVHGEEQETLLWMQIGSEITTEKGTWRCLQNNGKVQFSQIETSR